MPIKVELPEEDIPGLLEYYQSQRQIAVQGLSTIQEKIKSLDRTIQVLQASKSKHSSPSFPLFEPLISDSTYPTTGTWKDKVKFLLSAGKPMTTRELIDKIVQNQPELFEQRAKLINSVPATVSMMVKRGELTRISNANNPLIKDDSYALVEPS